MTPLKKDCYALVQQIVTKRDRLCKGPGCTNLSASGHHLFKRDNMGTAFNTRYVIGLCNNCHSWAQRHPDDCRQWAIYLLGDEAYHIGQRLAKSVVKYVDLEKIRDGLRKELDRLLG